MEDIKQRRKGFDQLGYFYEKASSVTIEPVSFDGVKCYWFIPERATADRIVIYGHGGAFSVGSIRSHGNMVSHFAQALQLKILFIDYALAPEHPYPKGINDIVNVYKTVLANYSDWRIDFAGDSAGGGILVSAISQLLGTGIPLPAKTVLISPWVNLRCDYPSQQENAGKDIISTEYLKASATDYAGRHTLEEASPDQARLDASPPLLIAVGTSEILLDDSKHLYQSVKKIQEKATISFYKDQRHNWPLADIHSESSKKLLLEMAGFLNETIPK